MSCLVNPTGWRLYFTKYWKSNYTISNRLYPLSTHTSRLIHATLTTILDRVKLKFFDKKNLFRFSTFKILLFNDTIYLLIKYKFYWRASRREYFFQLHRRMAKLRIKRLRGRRKQRDFGPEFSKNPLLRAFKKRKLQFLRRVRKRKNAAKQSRKKYLRYLWGRRPGKIFIQRRIFNFKRARKRRKVRKLFYFFFILPVFTYLKKYISNSISKLVPSSPTIVTFFLGLNKKNFNILDIMRAVNLYIREYQYTPTKTLYVLLKILKSLSRRQKLRGFKFLLAGRFSRRDRATYLWKTNAAVSLGSRMTRIEYITFPMFLNYSKCIAKLWICRK